MSKSELIKSIAEVAYLKGFEMKEPRLLEDGYIELVFTDKDDSEMEMSLDFKELGEFFHESYMVAMRYFDKDTNEPHVIYVSAVPYVIFGVMYGEV